MKVSQIVLPNENNIEQNCTISVAIADVRCVSFIELALEFLFRGRG